MIKSCIVIVAHDQLPDQGFLEAVVREYPTLSTVTTIVDGKMDISDPNTEYSAGDLQEYLVGNPSGTRIFWMCKSETTIPAESIQPFTVLDADGVDYAKAYITGELPGYTEPGTAEAWLKDTLEKSANELVFEDLNEGTLKLLEELRKPQNLEQFQTEFFGGKPGATVIMGSGTYALLANEKTELKADWGWSSDNCGFGVKAEKPKFGQKKQQATPAEPAKPSAPVVPSKPAEPPKTTESEPAGAWVTKHQSINGNTQAKEWIRNVLGLDQGSIVPDDLLTKVLSKEPIFVPKARWDVIRTKQIAKSIVVVKKPDLDRTQSVATPDTKPRGTDISTKNIPTGGSAVPVPVMSEETKSQVAALFQQPGSINKTLLDNQSKEIMSREDIKAFLDKHDDWYEQLKDKVKLDIEKHMAYPYEAILELARTNYQAVAVLAFTHACNRLMLMDKVKELEAKLKPDEKKEEKPVLTLPAKKGFGQRKTA